MELKSQQAFVQLKKVLMSLPILQMPNFELDFPVECDTLESKVGTVLQENHLSASLART